MAEPAVEIAVPSLEVSWSDLMSQGFPGFTTGDIITSSQVAGWLGSAILWAESLRFGGPAERSHVMIYAGGGNVISQDWRVREKSLREYAGSTLTVWHNPEYTPKQRGRLVAEARLHLGRLYDVPGILGQLFASATRCQWFANAIQSPGLTYCSEFVCYEMRRHLDPWFMPGWSDCQLSPDQMELCFTKAGWQNLTMQLTLHK